MDYSDQGYGGQRYGGGNGPSGPRAGFWRRLAAWIIDAVIIGLVGGLLTRATPSLGYLVQIAYAIGFFGAPRGQSPGFMAMGIRVVSMTDGKPIGYGRAAVRWIVAIVSGFAIGIGYLWMLWDREKQTWFDKASQSVVVPVAAYPLNPAS